MQAEAAMVERLLQELEEGTYRFTPVGVKTAIRDLGLKVEGDLEDLVGKVLERSFRQTKEALQGLWKALEAPSPLPGVEEVLRRGGWLQAWRSEFLEDRSVLLQLEGGGPISHSLPSHSPPLGTFSLKAWGGRIEVWVSPALFARRERAYLRTSKPKQVELALEGAKRFRPLFEALGLADLEEAIEALLGLKDGEVRQEGPYVLVRRGRLHVLRRGSLFGDLLRDKVFLIGQRPVVLPYPHGVKIAFWGSFSDANITLSKIEVRWRGEVARLGITPGGYWNALDRNPIPSLVRQGLRWGRKAHPPLSPRMSALIHELGEAEDPLEAPKEDEFFRRVHMRALALF
jgi:hypothetical protein